MYRVVHGEACIIHVRQSFFSFGVAEIERSKGSEAM